MLGNKQVKVLAKIEGSGIVLPNSIASSVQNSGNTGLELEEYSCGGKNAQRCGVDFQYR